MLKMKEILRKIAHFQVQHPVFSLMVVLMLTIMILGGVGKVNTVASLELMMPKSTPEIAAFNDLRDAGLGQDMIAIILMVDPNSELTNPITDIRDIRVYNYIKNLNEELLNEKDVLEIYSYPQIMDSYNLYGLDYEDFIDTLRSNYISDLDSFINRDYSTTVILIRSDIATDDSRMVMLSNKVKAIVNSMGKPEGIDIQYTGTPIIQQKLGKLITQDRSNTQWISTFLVFLVTMLIFRSVSSAIIPILVVFISINWLYGTMGYLSIPVSTLSGGVAAMVIGIGIDFAIHIMNKFKLERKEGKSIKDSVELALTHTGVALFATAATTIAAFLAFLFGAMPEMGRFGLLMTIGIMYSLIFSIFALPSMLILEEKIIYYIKDNFRFGLDGELHLEVDSKKELKRREDI